MDNLELYNKVRAVPQNAQRKIQGGRLDGKTDINPMWRIKALTENFGICGIGWKYEITNKWLETSEQTGEVAAFVDILLYVNVNGEWSAPIPGTGGSTFIAKERNGPHMSDECFKMALTDAISVACKALGVGADVYWEADRTKYTAQAAQAAEQPQKANATVTEKSVRTFQIERLVTGTKYNVNTANEYARKKYGKQHIDELTEAQYNELYNALDAAVKKEVGNGNS